jgi:hypothetical protein
MGTVPPRLVRLVLGLYPRSSRERYGTEIADLLARSPRPVRDLADVARCALADRGEELTSPATRPHLLRLAGLLAAPLVFGAVLTVLALVSLTVLAAVETLGYPVGYHVADVVVAATVVPVGAGAVWLARRTARTHSIAAAGLVVPTALALGTVAVASLPHLGGVLGETWRATLVSSVCWCAATVALATGGTALIRRGRAGAARFALILGGLAVLDLACMVYLLLAGPSIPVPLSSAFASYPTVMTGTDLTLAGDPAQELSEEFKGLPAVLTVCTVFALTLVAATARRRTAEPDPATTSTPA